jgi:multidrug efflux pump subunit AcrA (membrane-fusion protein)
VISGCNRENGSDLWASKIQAVSNASALTVNVLQVRRAEQVIETVVFFGTVKPNRQSQLGFERGGTIKNVFHEVGDQVKAGEKLAELEQEPLEIQKRDIEQALLVANQRLNSTDRGQVESAQQEIQVVERQLQGVKAELANGQIVAPFDSIVSERSFGPGELAGPRTPVFQVIETSQVLVETVLPRIIAESLQVDQSVWIDVGDLTVQAQFKFRSPVEFPVGSKIVTLKVTGQLKAESWSYGQIVKIRFFVPTENSGFWLPFSALSRESNGLWSALVVSKNVGASGGSPGNDEPTVSRKMLELVQLENEWGLARGALVDGEFVIVDGLHRIVPGQRVMTNDVSDQYPLPGAGVQQ